IRRRVSPEAAKRIEIMLKRLGYEGQRVQLAKDRQADAKTAADAKRLLKAAVDSRKFTPAENQLFNQSARVRLLKRKGMYVYSHEERAAAGETLRPLGQKAA